MYFRRVRDCVAKKMRSFVTLADSSLVAEGHRVLSFIATSYSITNRLHVLPSLGTSYIFSNISSQSTGHAGSCLRGILCSRTYYFFPDIAPQLVHYSIRIAPISVTAASSRSPRKAPEGGTNGLQLLVWQKNAPGRGQSCFVS